MNIPLPPFAPENLVSRDGFDSPVPRQPAHLHTQAESGAYLRDSSRVPRRRPCIYLNHFTPSGQSQVYRVAQLRTDAVHCREFAGTWPINLKVFPNECCLSRSPCPHSRLRIWSRETVSTVPSRVSLLISILQAQSSAYLRDSSQVPLRRPFIFDTHYVL